MEIDETKLPESLLVVNEDGTKTLDYSKIKTQADVDNVLQAKDHVKTEYAAFKEKYKTVDIDKYNAMVNAEMEQNKDVLSNPVYKNLQTTYSDLQTKYSELEKQIQARDAAIFDSELKDQIRKVKGVQETAIDDILHRVKASGFTRTEGGILDKDGKTVEAYLDGLRSSAPHLFKRTVGLHDQNSEKLQKAIKSGTLADIIANSPIKL